MKKVLYTILIILICSCSKNIKDYTLAELQNNQDKDKIIKDLTEKEQKLLVLSTMRYVLKENIDLNKSEDLKRATITIGELIHEQQKIVDEEIKYENEKQAKIKEINKYLIVSVVEKSYTEGMFEKQNILKIKVKNISNKEISAFKISIDIKDLLDEQLQNLSFSRDESIKPNVEIIETRYWDYNQFVNEDIKFKNTDLSKLNINCSVMKILFADGSKIYIDE